MAKLTIVVPVYNAAGYLPTCVRSILAQTFSDFKLLLLNDGSTDNSPNLCDLYATEDARISAVHHENIGVEQTILQGIALVDTPYVTFVDSDDWLLPEAYEVLLYLLDEYGADLLQYGALINGDPHGATITCQAERSVTNAKETCYRPFFEETGSITPFTNARWNKIYHTETLQAAIADVPQGVSIGEDLLMNLVYLRRCKKAVALAGHALYCYRSAEGSLSNKYSETKQTSILKLYPLLSALAAREGYRDDAVQLQGNNETCALMLDALQSSISVQEKCDNLRLLYKHLPKKSHILRYAKDRPMVGKIALFFVWLRLFWLIAALVTKYNDFTARRYAA